MINLARHGERERQQRSVIAGRLDELREAASALRDENEALNARLDQSLFDEALTYEELNKADARIRHLQSRLRESGQFDDASAGLGGAGGRRLSWAAAAKAMDAAAQPKSSGLPHWKRPLSKTLP